MWQWILYGVSVPFIGLWSVSSFTDADHQTGPSGLTVFFLIGGLIFLTLGALAHQHERKKWEATDNKLHAPLK